MFLKSLSITTGDGDVIREIPFHQGLNLIVDETPSGDGRETGNGVGKTTVLKLINFCLGGDAREIYTDTENKRNEYRLVKEFLISKRVLVTLTLTESLSHPNAKNVVIERNFLRRKDKIQRIEGVNRTDDEFDAALTDLLFPGHFGRKPTFRQIISHNIRYKDESINYTLKTLDKFSKNDEYETLYLFLLGCDFSQGNLKQELRAKIDLEDKLRRRLESSQTKSGYEALLVQVNEDIETISARRAGLDLNPNFEKDMEKLNRIRYQINVASSDIGRLELRRELIAETQREMNADRAKIDLNQLRQLYSQATSLVTGIQKTFDELYEFHNRMVASKIRFISEELPQINELLTVKRERLQELVNEEADLATLTTKTESFTALEELVTKQNALYEQKGEYENIIRELTASETKLSELNSQLEAIDVTLYSDEFFNRLKAQIITFNRFFAKISSELYGERYVLKADRNIFKGRPIYEFTSFNTNFSSGKKLGEISCFDIAYTLFADYEGIPCMHFLLSDKKELMHGNQLLKIADVVKNHNIQFVASILKDKLPLELQNDEYIVLRLSPENKLFRIEAE